MPIEGGCFCGAVRYRIDAPVRGVRACYCRKCQYMGAGGPNYVAMAAKAAFQITRGEPRRHSAPADSGNDVARLFCGDCGTYLWSDSPAYDVYPVRVGTLDDPSGMIPQVQIWTEAAQPWHHIDPDIPAHPRGAPPAA
jgi:hypothetical protein